jgi:hypothetical protein
MGQEVVVQQNQLPPALQQFVETAHLPRRAFLPRHDAKGAPPRASPSQKTQRPIAQLPVQAIVGRGGLDLGQQADLKVHARTADGELVAETLP